MPHAGKTWLLGALAEAAHSQQHRLHGRLVLVSKGLEQLRHEVYDQRAHRSTLGEIVPYDARYEPLDSATSAWEVTLIDCEGRRANELLAQARAWQAADRDGSLAQALLEADALLLVVDVADEPPQLDADFSQFHRFLQQLEEHRGRRAAVGGLPVWLVLTKCDLLAQPGDGAADWMERIEERKREVDRRFRAFRPGGSATELPAFGRIELHLWATAVMRPALGGIPAQPREPYGVAELFRHCFEEAAQFRRRGGRAQRRRRAPRRGRAPGVVGMVLRAGAVARRHQTAPRRRE
ncbi:MAG: hypothetical protein NZ700_09105, partial [Gemmataceae bacterium]|nr:hypothetical protein [Gemmataceae bacterium]MDW8265370.1 hypothetical protein [Gemmataceae bacterium]